MPAPRRWRMVGLVVAGVAGWGRAVAGPGGARGGAFGRRVRAGPEAPLRVACSLALTATRTTGRAACIGCIFATTGRRTAVGGVTTVAGAGLAYRPEGGSASDRDPHGPRPQGGLGSPRTGPCGPLGGAWRRRIERGPGRAAPDNRCHGTAGRLVETAEGLLVDAFGRRWGRYVYLLDSASDSLDARADGRPSERTSVENRLGAFCAFQFSEVGGTGS